VVEHEEKLKGKKIGCLKYKGSIEIITQEEKASPIQGGIQGNKDAAERVQEETS
jgi:hypothetical protein